MKRMALGAGTAFSFSSITRTGSLTPTVAPQDRNDAPDWRNAALIVVDMQNDFVRAGLTIIVNLKR